MKQITAAHIRKRLKNLADPAIAEHSQRFFKTGEGEYAQGDKFLGLRVPVLRKLAKEFQSIEFAEVQRLLESEFHEVRLCALFILIHQFNSADADRQTAIYHLYLNNTHNINNWDLVDCSAYKILGEYLKDKDRSILYELCISENLWERRIAIITTLKFIKSDQYTDTLKLAVQLINDDHDLIHKAVGWMLREVGNRNLAIEQQFLNKHYKTMPRTMLRYAIEKFPQASRKKYLSGDV